MYFIKPSVLKINSMNLERFKAMWILTNETTLQRPAILLSPAVAAAAAAAAKYISSVVTRLVVTRF